MAHYMKRLFLVFLASALSLGIGLPANANPVSAPAELITATGITDIRSATSTSSTPIVSTRDLGDDVAYNYVVNLAQEATSQNLKRAHNIIQSTGGQLLTSYSQFNSLTVQAAQSGYSKKLANALTQAGIPLHSIGWTRPSAVRSDEVLIEGAQGKLPGNELELAGADAEEPDWNMQTIGATSAHTVDVPLEPVTVGILDSGIDATHPALTAKVDRANSTTCTYNGIPNPVNNPSNDSVGHGTHIAGIIAGTKVKDQKFQGIAPNATLLDIQVLTKENTTAPEYYVCGFVWAAEHDVDIANESFGGFYNPSSTEEAGRYEFVRRAAAYASDHDVLHVAIAHNQGVDLDKPSAYGYFDAIKDTLRCVSIAGKTMMPAGLNDVLSVSSVEHISGTKLKTKNSLRRSVWSSPILIDGDLTCSYESSSNYGSTTIDIAAPGSDIRSTLPHGEYGAVDGTSMAAPHVTAVAALLKGIHPDYSAEQIRALLLEQSKELYPLMQTPKDRKEYRGSGLVNALAAVTRAQPTPTIEKVEYSLDNGQTWTDLNKARVYGEILIRLTITGPVTMAQANIGEDISEEKQTQGTFNEKLEMTIPLTVDEESPEHFMLSIHAYGRNNDPRADDDINLDVPFYRGEKTCRYRSTQEMYRLYNHMSHEHLYTADNHERDVLTKGDWTYEGIGWVAPTESDTPVYRLYSPILGDHHYTADAHERDVLVAHHHWIYEGVGWYSDDCQNAPVYRQFNPELISGSHNYTADLHEYEVNNARNGWKAEGIAWYAISWK